MNLRDKLLIFIIALFSCNSESGLEKSVTKGVNCMQTPFGIEDELIVRDKDKKTIYRIEITNDGSFPVKNSELELSIHEISEKSVNETFNESTSFQNEYPYYFINSLKFNNQLDLPIVSFYTTQRSYPFGSDPIKITHWVFFNGKLYQNHGELPMQAEQVSNSLYSLKFDSLLTETNQTLKRICEDDWINFRTEWNNALVAKHSLE